MRYLAIFLLLFAFTACPAEQETEQPADQDEAVEDSRMMEEEQDAADEEMAEDSGSSITTEEVTYSANGVDLKGYIAYDESIEGKRPGVIVVHEWWGHNEYARTRAEDLAELGYTGFAIDMYGEGKKTEHPEDAEKFMMQVFNNMDKGEARFNAALDLLKQHPTVNSDQIGAIGYCFGGAIVLHMARVGTDLDGVVSFHGNLTSMHEVEPGSIKAKILVAHGAEDKFTTMEQLEAFKKEMDKAGADYQVIVYENAEHSFTNPNADEYSDKLPLAYNEKADEKSWEDMKQFFKKVFSSK